MSGVEDAAGALMPFLRGDAWEPVICLETGRIEGWPQGVRARTLYKVCDDCHCALLDTTGDEVVAITGRIPKILRPGGCGLGDYVVMTIDESGRIENLCSDLSEFADAAGS